MFSFVQQILYSRIDELIENFDLVSLFEIVVIALIISSIYYKFIKNSPSKKLFKGILTIFLLYIFSKCLLAMHLFIFGRFLETITLIMLFSLVVIFQPELRRFLGYLGQPGFIRKTFFQVNKEAKKDNNNFVKDLSDAIRYLSKSKIGALIVVQESENMSAYGEIGTKIDGLISSELLLTIFHPNTALHDGAVVLTPDKILSAGVLLPLTENPELSWQYGTRHRAAIGITELTSATCIVVSEETGFVSFAKGGHLKKIDTIEMLNSELTKLINSDETTQKKKFSFIHKNTVTDEKNSANS